MWVLQHRSGHNTARKTALSGAAAGCFKKLFEKGARYAGLGTRRAGWHAAPGLPLEAAAQPAQAGVIARRGGGVGANLIREAGKRDPGSFHAASTVLGGAVDLGWRGCQSPTGLALQSLASAALQ